MQQRQLVILRGQRHWCEQSAAILLSNINAEQRIYITDKSIIGYDSLKQKQARQQLGQECDAVIFDGLGELNLDSLGIMLGTIRAGGVLILYLPQSSADSIFLTRFNHVITRFINKTAFFHQLEQADELPTLQSIELENSTDSVYQSDDQLQAVQAIHRVVTGHRRRPLVLSADRGRGKSASLGIAAAQLILQGKKSIIVTAPSLAVAATLFKHAAALLPDATSTAGHIIYQQAEIRFIAVDVLISSEIKADLLLVDEAAAIPAALLQHLLEQYSRIVYASTLHGYEGTGRGFVIRFQQILQQLTPNWHHYQMHTPIRWAQDDALEAFSFEALCLNASPVEQQLIADVNIEHCSFMQIDRHTLLDNEQDLQQIFGLMVLAHYRTRPSDLQILCDRDDVSLWVVRYKGHIIATAWLVNEGLLEHDLAMDIYAGKRRLKGHLLPQSLLAHAGISNAGGLHFQRIIRLAVHPAVQQRGIATALLEHIMIQANKNKLDIIGASFGISTELIDFWTSTGFNPVRLGLHKDEVSASNSVMVLQPCSSQGQLIIEQASQRFYQQWPYLVSHYFNHLASDLVVKISQSFPAIDGQISDLDWQEICAFCYGQRGFDFSVISLRTWMQSLLCRPVFLELSAPQQQLCVMVLIQQCDWPFVCKSLNYSGKKQAIKALREQCRKLVELTG